MSDYVLLIDHALDSLVAVELAIADTPLSVVRVDDLPAAKRRLVSAVPRLILAAIAGDATFKFCEELRAHEQFAAIPVLLLAESLVDEQIRRAGAVGVRGLVQLPLKPDALRHRIATLAPELGIGLGQAEKREAVVAETPPPQAAPAQKQQLQSEPSPRVEKGVAPEKPPEDKFRLAQSLLAKVLHNLKTSALLEVTEAEDIPQIVFEMTKSVCDQAAKSKRSPQELLSLEQAFRVKSSE